MTNAKQKNLHNRVKHTRKCFGVCFDPQLGHRIEEAAQMEGRSISDWFEIAAELLLSQNAACLPEPLEHDTVKHTDDETK